MKKLLSIVPLLLLSAAAWAATVAQAPTSTTATIKGTDVAIAWVAPAANTDGTKPAKVAGYNVYRSTSSSITTKAAGGAAPIAGGAGNGIMAPTVTWTDKGASAGKYFYGVSAWYCDSASGCAESALSNVVGINQPTPTPPASNPVPVTSAATLSWTAPTTNTDGSPLTDLSTFNIYQGTSPAGMTKVATVGASGGTYTTPVLQPGTYYFSVTAVNAAGAESTKSAVVSTTISPPPIPKTPGQPQNVKITVTVTAG